MTERDRSTDSVDHSVHSSVYPTARVTKQMMNERSACMISINDHIMENPSVHSTATKMHYNMSEMVSSFRLHTP